jgi:RimJ/RimL family protein N-acetyltransferase
MDLSPVVLSGTHVRLEPLSLLHLDGLVDVGLAPDLWERTTTRIGTRGEMEDYVRTALLWQSQNTALPFATIEQETGRVVGSTRFANADHANRRIEIGWTWVAPPWQRSAVNTEAKLLMMRHAFDTLGCIRVEFKTDALNTRSRAALARIGAREEGILRSHMLVQGGRRRDSVYFSVIEEEWQDVEAALRAKLERDHHH